MVKTSPSNAAGVDAIPGQGAKIPHPSWPKKKKRNINNRSNIVTNSIKTLKNGPHQRKSFFKKVSSS